jgi:hypothetical protein
MQLPEALVWSKVGPEAGLTVDAILRWKELQRQLGDGLFFWGIGTSIKSGKVAQVHRRCGHASVLFSIQPSAAKASDQNPSAICLWSHFIDGVGREQPVPNGACVTSKAGNGKSKHYALICKTSTPLRIRRDIDFDVGAYKNLDGGAIGNSQVTAVIEKCEPPKKVRAYPIGFMASLDQPYVATLTKPKLLTQSQAAQQRALMNSGNINIEQFGAFLSDLRAS